MKRKVYLYGKLAKRVGRVIELAVDTAGEAIRAIICNFPEFEADMRVGSYHVVRGPKRNTGHSLDLDQVRDLQLGKADIHIFPRVAGSKNSGGLLKTLLGVALVGVALFMGVGAPLLGGLGIGATWGNVAMIGAGLALYGASTFLAGEQDGKEKKTESFTMTGPSNSYNQGMPVPIVYGRSMVGTQLISAGLDIEQLIRTGNSNDDGKDKDDDSEGDVSSGYTDIDVWGHDR